MKQSRKVRKMMDHSHDKLYLEQLKAITACTKEQTVQLLNAVKQGDRRAKDRLVEGYLHQAAALAEKYDRQGLPLGDLIQEANMALVVAVEEWQGEEFSVFVCDRIRTALEEALRDVKAQAQVGEELAARVNVLQEVSRIMAQELGREATVEELAQKMKMSQEEIRAIMKMTLDAVGLGEREEA